MKCKIAAIFAADIAGYSRPAAEETLPRLASYREVVVDDFIARAGDCIFNTAGDAVLAELRSAVDAVHPAFDIPESFASPDVWGRTTT